MSITRTCLVTLACALVATAAPAGAVVGGEPVAPESVPWFAEVNGCGGMLVAPDRVLTAGHCVAHAPLQNLAGVSVGTELRRGTRYAMHPGWRHANGPHNVFDDVALVQLDVPVTSIAPVSLGGGGVASGETWILGRGRQFAQGTGHNEAQTLAATGLRQAALRPIGDEQCAAAWKHRRGNGGERFDAARMLCAIDVDGLEPLSSGCNGDSGGPLYTGTAAAPVLLGVVSWGSTRCGADHTPSVFADVARYRDVITDPSPTWTPSPTSAAKVTGSRRVGGKLRCAVDGYIARPTKVEVAWQRQGGRRPVNVGHARTYKVTKADAGHPLVCTLTASNDGGVSTAAFAPSSMVKIPR
jgi:secreted trypsin-like serine protease